MFADDIACADYDADLTSLITRANTELKNIPLWFGANKMAVNISKTLSFIMKAKLFIWTAKILYMMTMNSCVY
jgi:hypothetical protein